LPRLSQFKMADDSVKWLIGNPFYLDRSRSFTNSNSCTLKIQFDTVNPGFTYLFLVFFLSEAWRSRYEKIQFPKKAGRTGSERWFHITTILPKINGTNREISTMVQDICARTYEKFLINTIVVSLISWVLSFHNIHRQEPTAVCGSVMDWWMDEWMDR